MLCQNTTIVTKKDLNMAKIKHTEQLILGMFTLLITSITNADTITSDVSKTDGTSVGKIVFEDSQYGLLIKPQLKGLPEGARGFHIHQHPDCGNHAMNAGAHLDPANTNSHQGPYGQGHLGDLPVLVVDSAGAAIIPLLAPRLKVKDIQGHAIMIHEGGDNYSDNPALGGGGARIACGKIEK
jgi:Cu-Zn family superoxide dismutase